jgi:hypothetical protein
MSFFPYGLIYIILPCMQSTTVLASGVVRTVAHLGQQGASATIS